MGLSVLMSVYNKEKPDYLRKALESIIQQTYIPDEIVLIKDGVLNEELECVINQYKEYYPKFVLYQFEQNVQLGRALAKGVELCSNDIIARMDTDDIAVENRLELQYQYMQNHKEIDVLGGYIEEFSDESEYRKVKKMPENMQEILRYARFRNPVNHMTVMFRRQAVLESGNYRHFVLLEDYELWSRMLGMGKKFHNLQQVLVQARTNEGMYSRRGGYKYFKQYVTLRKEQRKLGIVSGKECIVAIMLSFVMTMEPAFLRKLMYRKILRGRG